MNPGFWQGLGAPASVDWCEPNYVVTPYVAEWWNTLSSLPLIGLGVLGIVLALRARRPAQPRYLVAFGLLALIGVGSAAFHGTLLKLPQALDELPMVWCGLAYTYIVRWRHGSAAEEPARRRWKLGLLAYAAVFTGVYFLLEDYFQFFIATYALIVAYLAVRTWQISFRENPSPQLKRLFFWSVICYVGGVAFLWIPEHVLLACDHPFQGLMPHAWFHLTSGIGSYAWLFWALCDREGAPVDFAHQPVTG